MVMLITVYQKQARGWRAIRSYYRFDHSRIEEIPAGDPVHNKPKKPRYQCPGCLVEFTDAALSDHVCFGGAPGYPRLVPLTQRGRPRNNLSPRDEQTRQPD